MPLGGRHCEEQQHWQTYQAPGGYVPSPTLRPSGKDGENRRQSRCLGGAGSKVDADAQFMIGQMYAKGRGVEKNKEMSKCLLDLDDAYMLVSKDGIKWT